MYSNKAFAIKSKLYTIIFSKRERTQSINLINTSPNATNNRIAIIRQIRHEIKFVSSLSSSILFSSVFYKVIIKIYYIFNNVRIIFNIDIFFI